MGNTIIVIGLKKACVVLHGLAFAIKDENARKETLALVDVICEAIKILEVPA